MFCSPTAIQPASNFPFEFRRWPDTGLGVGSGAGSVGGKGTSDTADRATVAAVGTPFAMMDRNRVSLASGGWRWLRRQEARCGLEI